MRQLSDLSSIAYVAIGLLGLLVSLHHLPAGFSPEDVKTGVEIEGVNYGTFDSVAGVDLDSHANFSHRTITFRRGFVTDPSLYLWAKTTANQHSGLKDIHLVTRNEAGVEISRQVLTACQPLAWTVEAAAEGLGGFHETVEVAVQDVKSLAR